MFPKGSLDPALFAELTLNRERWCMFSATTSSPSQKLAELPFLFQEGLSFFLESGIAFSAQLPSISSGAWGRAGLVNKVVMHYRRRRLTSETFGFPKCHVWWSDDLMIWASWSSKTCSNVAVFRCLTTILHPAFWGQKEIRKQPPSPKKKKKKCGGKKKESCFASMKFMRINRMMLLSRW